MEKPCRICPRAACHHRIPDPQWKKELDYRLIKELWAFGENRIAVRFAYEWHDDSGNWLRSYGNENWEFDSNGLMHQRHASINDLPIKETERKFRWDASKPVPWIILADCAWHVIFNNPHAGSRRPAGFYQTMKPSNQEDSTMDSPLIYLLA